MILKKKKGGGTVPICQVRGFDTVSREESTASLDFYDDHVNLWVNGQILMLFDNDEWNEVRSYVTSHVAREWIPYMKAHGVVRQEFGYEIVDTAENLQVIASLFNISSEIDVHLKDHENSHSVDQIVQILESKGILRDQLPPRNILYFPSTAIQEILRRDTEQAQAIRKTGYLFEMAVQKIDSRKTAHFRPYNTPLVAHHTLDHNLEQTLAAIRSEFHRRLEEVGA